MNNLKKNMLEGLYNAYIDSDKYFDNKYIHSLVSNDSKRNKKVSTVLEEELQTCDSFLISVAFITLDGIERLLLILDNLKNKGIKGKILTTDYLMFNQPRALDVLSSLSNIELRIYKTEQDAGFHTKGYIFSKEDINVILLGSSNLTSKAINKNIEWNTRLISTKDGNLSKSIISEFNRLWDNEHTVLYSLYKEEYRKKYESEQAKKIRTMRKELSEVISYDLKPNTMQEHFVDNLKALIKEKKQRVLFVSATGDCVIIVTGCENIEYKRISKTFQNNKNLCIA